MHMLHHISLGVTNIERAASFYDAALGALDYVRVWSDLRPGERDQAVGYGEAGGGDKLALKQISSAFAIAMPGFHIAFSAQSHHAVIGFHAAAVAAGATDNGKPGLREHYAPNYFAAFVIEPEGHHLEAVCKSAA